MAGRCLSAFRVLGGDLSQLTAKVSGWGSEGKQPSESGSLLWPTHKMAQAGPTVTININPEEVRLCHDPASICFVDRKDLECYFTLQAAVVAHEEVFSARVLGHKLVVREPTVIIAPFVLHLSEGNDLIVGAFKHRNGIWYFYGVPAARVKDFVAAGLKPADFKEEQFWTVLKCSSQMLRTVTVLENTESAKLLDGFVAILKLTPMFAANKLTSAVAMANWAQKKSFVDVVKANMLQAEKRERKAASDKGAAARAEDVSRDGGADAGRSWREAQEALLKHRPFYEQSFPERFIIMENAGALDACRKDLEKSALKEWLLPEVERHAASDWSLEQAPPNTPLKRLLEPPPPKPAAAQQPPADTEQAPAEAAPAEAPTEAATEAAAALPAEQPARRGRPPREPKKPEPATAAQPEPPKPKAKKGKPDAKAPNPKPRDKRKHGDGDDKPEGAPEIGRGRQKTFPDVGEWATPQQTDRMLSKIQELETSYAPLLEPPPPALPAPRKSCAIRELTWGLCAQAKGSFVRA